MNVMQNEKLLNPPGERNETRVRDPFIGIPSLARFEIERDRRMRAQWRPGNSSFLSPACPGTSARGRATSTSVLATSSRNYTRSATKSTTGVATSDSSGVILAITTGRGDARTEVGIAAMNIQHPHLVLCQISDAQTHIHTLSKLYLFDPIEVLMPETMCGSHTNRNVLFSSIASKFPDLPVTPISRIHFNDASGLERVKTLCAAEYSSVELFVKEKYYALSAAAALLKYIEYTQRIIYAPKSIKIEFQGSPNATIIDLESARSLELVQSQCGQRNVNLLGILDTCLTPMGRKLLRASILQPPCQESVILERQVSVAELVANSSLRSLLQPIVRRLYGADRLVALSTAPVSKENTVQCAEQNLNYVLLLKNLLDVVPELQLTLYTAQSKILLRIHKNLQNPRFRSMSERILETIHPDAKSVGGYTSANMQRCFAIKAGINDLLDIARQTYCELIDDMKSMVENLASKYNLMLSLGCNASLGYHIQAVFPRNWNADNFVLPEEFIEVRKSRRALTMTTNALATLSQQCNIASEELHLMSNVLLSDLLHSLRENIVCLFQLSADAAELDLIMALARMSCIQTYVKPTFGHKLELIESRHPVLETLDFDNPVPNNATASVPFNFHVITGPNMSGKSTYLKQIVLLQIMAQIGCFVPAKKATFRITDLIYCKIAVRDDIECNASTFTLEMKESQHILRSVTPTSLVILDELCKGTSVDEGSSIAWAICEKLLNTTAFVFIATHFAFLTKLADVYYNVTNHYFETISVRGDEGNHEQLTYTHRLKRGVTPINDYGIALAELCGLPKNVTEKAREFASGRAATDQVTAQSNAAEKECYALVAQLYELIETDKFERDCVASIFARIAKLECFEGSEEPMEFANKTEEKESCEKKTDENEDINNSMTSFNTSIRALGTPIHTNCSSRENHAASSMKSNASSSTQISSNVNNNNNLFSPISVSQRYAATGHSTSTSFHSVLERHPSVASSSQSFFSVQHPERDVSFALSGSMLTKMPSNLSVTSAIAPPQASNAENESLHEYYLSDSDFELSDASFFTNDTIDKIDEEMLKLG